MRNRLPGAKALTQPIPQRRIVGSSSIQVYIQYVRFLAHRRTQVQNWFFEKYNTGFSRRPSRSDSVISGPCGFLFADSFFNLKWSRTTSDLTKNLGSTATKF